MNKNLMDQIIKLHQILKSLKITLDTLNRSLVMLGNYHKKIQKEEKV